jgi:hypothetical protein
LDGVSSASVNDAEALSGVVNNWSRPQQLSGKATLFGNGSGSKTLRQVHPPLHCRVVELDAAR